MIYLANTQLSSWLYTKYIQLVLLFIISTACSTAEQAARKLLPDLNVSENGHYLVNRDGTPFYWIGDTGWAMFQQLTREEVNTYLDDRVEKGFTVIQSVIFWYPHGALEAIGPLNETNAYGHRPFRGEPNDPDTSVPLLVEGGSVTEPNDYWDHADYVIEAVRKRGLKLAVLPCWGNAFINNRMRDSRIEFTENEARQYGRFLGGRYREQSHIVWVLGGDVDPVNFGDQDQRSVYRAMAEGLGQGTSGNDSLKWDTPDPDWDKSLITFHAVRTPKLSGEGGEGGSSSIWFHNDAWLDFNMMETFRWLHKVYPYVTEDYRKEPVKPTLLGEGAYEIGKYKNECGFITPLKVRRQGYHAFFAGATGYTYGHWSVWPFRGAYCGVSWQEALDYPAAAQVGKVMKSFVAEQEIFSWMPDQSIILSKNDVPEVLACALIKNDSSKVLVYLPEVREVKVDLNRLKPSTSQSSSWFDPRNGDVVQAQSNPENTFTPPSTWEDAILIVR